MKFKSFAAFASVISLSAAPALAQTTLQRTTAAQTTAAPAGETPAADAEPDPDEMADSLNARQQLDQTVTLTRTINGEVVSEDRRSVDYGGNAPRRPSEGRKSLIGAVSDEYDQETLTRNEALDEARLDFALADLNRDGGLTAEEFSAYVLTPVSNGSATQTGAVKTQRAQFVAALDAESATARRSEAAQTLFDSIVTEAARIEAARNPDRKKKKKKSDNAQKPVTERLFGVAYVRAFDQHDANNDGVLTGEELSGFRAARNGFRTLARKTVEDRARAETAD